MARPNYYENYQDALKRNQRLADKHATDIDAVIDGLGIREAYPNETATREEPVIHGWDQVGTYRLQEVTRMTYGRDRFLADVRLAAAAARGSEAAARIAAALKGKK